MKLLYDSTKSSNNIYYAVTDATWFMFAHTTNIPLTEFEIDEVDPENKDLCIDLVAYAGKGRFDINGLEKYYIDTGELYERDNWEEVSEMY